MKLATLKRQQDEVACIVTECGHFLIAPHMTFLFMLFVLRCCNRIRFNFRLNLTEDNDFYSAVFLHVCGCVIRGNRSGITIIGTA